MGVASIFKQAGWKFYNNKSPDLLRSAPYLFSPNP